MDKNKAGHAEMFKGKKKHSNFYPVLAFIAFKHSYPMNFVHNETMNFGAYSETNYIREIFILLLKSSSYLLNHLEKVQV